MSKPRLIVWTLNIGDYQPAIRALTMPLMRHWAKKIGAEFREITERKFPGWPVVYEKLQLHDLGKQSEWTIFLDADTLVHPDMFDPTIHIPKNTVAHNGRDMANIRWRYDEYFMRDGRDFGSCNWCAIASEWCLDLWKPLDIPLAEAVKFINPTADEMASGVCHPEHLIDDYTLSRNIARYGLKATTLVDVCGNLGFRDAQGRGASPYFFHLYNIPEREKIERMLGILTTPRDKGGWQMMSGEEMEAFRKQWGIK